MSPSGLDIEFHPLGIATVLQRYDLVVPTNQRSYAWHEGHVRQLFQDIGKAIAKPHEPYFLGTVVLTHGSEGRLEVADGQQRLATTAILIAALRDLLAEGGANEKKSAEHYTREFLMHWNVREQESRPKLTLNKNDARFFTETVQKPPSERTADPKAIRGTASNDRLVAAYEIAREFVQGIGATLAKRDHYQRLYDWVEFLSKRVIVIAIIAPTNTDAYRMFETLNDRGLRASQADILKNYLFSEAADSTAEAEPKWSSMISVIESVAREGREDELVIDFLRHFWITRNGPTVERELAASIKDNVAGRAQAVDLIHSIDLRATDYTALLTPLEHPRLQDYGPTPRAYIYTITNVLGIEQIRPLLLAILEHFTVAEARLALPSLVSWSVRFLVAGGGGGGRLDTQYGSLAKAIHDQHIKTAANLRRKMDGVAPNDARFAEAFEAHQSTKQKLARYYLASLEHAKIGTKHPAVAYVEDPELRFNLEHVLPKTPTSAWKTTQDIVDQYGNRLGNMLLLPAATNVQAANLPFDKKREIYRSDPRQLTQEVADCLMWGPAEIVARQKRLAKLAIATWPL